MGRIRQPLSVRVLQPRGTLERLHGGVRRRIIHR